MEWLKDNELNGLDSHCEAGTHIWIAHFYKSGALAYWVCEKCEARINAVAADEEMVLVNGGWPDPFPILVSVGEHPSESQRKWRTRDSHVLVEVEPAANHFMGIDIPEIPFAFSYSVMDEMGNEIARYMPELRRIGFNEQYWLIRYFVEGYALIQYKVFCYEESTMDLPYVKEAERSVILAGLEIIG